MERFRHDIHGEFGVAQSNLGYLTTRYSEETGHVTKKEIVKKISEDIGLTQLKTKEIVQKTFDAIVRID